jgi:HK97 family phage portal protein
MRTYACIVRDVWPFRRRQPPQPAGLISVGDPALVELFRFGGGNWSGAPVSERTALGLSAMWRAVNLVSGTAAMLPMPTIREVQGVITQVGSVFDDPGAVVNMTPYEWKQTVFAHQMLHGAAFLAHVRNQGGGLAGLVPIHPGSVQIDPPPMPARGELDTPYRRSYSATLQDGSRMSFTDANLTYCPALSLDGRTGLGLIHIAANALGIGIAGDRAAGNMFRHGALMSGVVSPADGEDWDEGDARLIKADLDAKATGWENASSLAVINRRLKLQPWQMTNEAAQFMQGRQFQIEEVARFTGVPPHLLMQTEKQTSWGTGVAEQNRGLSRYTLAHWTTRLEQRLSRLLPAPRRLRFDYHEWERPTPETEVELITKQYEAKLITLNEARAKLALPPVPGGDDFSMPAPAPAPEQEVVGA